MKTETKIERLKAKQTHCGGCGVVEFLKSKMDTDKMQYENELANLKKIA